MKGRRAYSLKLFESNTCRARISNLSVHFKNTVETAAAIKGKRVKRALAFLKNVIERKECVPFKKYNGGVGRCAQAKNHGWTQGRWPQKSAKALTELIEHAVSNAEYHGLDVDSMVVTHIQVNPAPLNRRRTYRAHGVITPYMSHPCHVQVILSEVASK